MHLNKEETTNNSRKTTVIIDKWQPLGIGWKSQQDVAKAVGLPSFDVPSYVEFAFGVNSNVYETQMITSNLSLYKDTVAQLLQVCLQPCSAVIESLEDSMRNWNARLPVSPKKLAEEKKHATPEKPQADQDCSADAKSKLWEREVAYAVTYVNTYGESPESEWSDAILIPLKCTAITVTLEKIQFEGDFTAGLKPVKKEGKTVPRDRGIRRRVYIRYTDNEARDIMQRVAEVGEGDESFTHTIIDVKKQSN